MDINHSTIYTYIDIHIDDFLYIARYNIEIYTILSGEKKVLCVSKLYYTHSSTI